ncbi:hypothetical protein ACJ41O_011702 [Fusarium nematophilum]
MLDKPILFSKVLLYTLAFFYREWRRAALRSRDALSLKLTGSKTPPARTRNIVIVGANFAGYQAARVLALNLPPNSDFRVVIVEPNSHFQFTWVLPRYCVAKGHEHKAYIPYGPNLKGAPEEAFRWVRDRAVGVTKTHVKLQDGGEEDIPYEYLIVATGSLVEGLPSRSNATDKLESMRRLQKMQEEIEKATKIVVVGGGAAGVELATDAKSKYPDKTVVLVHSRKAPMHRFGEDLQKSAVEGMEKLGVELILEDRVVNEDKDAGAVTLRSGKVIECDYFVNCTGQRPASDILKDLAPNAISESGHIKVKPTLQIDDPSLPNIYACGDVADTKTPNPNGRSASRQADVAADNVLCCVRGKKPSYTYENYWADGIIKLTLGLDRSVTYLGDGKKVLLWESEEKDEALMAAQCWAKMGVEPFEDEYMKNQAVDKEQV